MSSGLSIYKDNPHPHEATEMQLHGESMQTNSAIYLEICFPMARKGLSLTPAPSYSMISVPLPRALPAWAFEIHSPGWMWWSHLVGVWRSWIKPGLMAENMIRARPPEHPGCICAQGCGEDWLLSLQNCCLSPLEGPEDHGRPQWVEKGWWHSWCQKTLQGSLFNSSKTSAKCRKWEGLTPDSDTAEGLAGEQLCEKVLGVVGQKLSPSPHHALTATETSSIPP